MQLTSEQKEAIQHFKGPAIVIAGPGSGKTRVIIERVKYLINKKEINPEKILVTTFTEKAASELKIRLSLSLSKKAELIHISTIHSLCKTLLEDYFTFHSLGSQFDVLDEEGQKLFINVNKFRLKIFNRTGWLNIIKKNAGWNSRKEDVICSLYNFFASNNVDIKEFKKDLKKKKELTEDSEKLVDSYLIYLELLEREKKIDFANLQLKLYKMISKNKEMLQKIQNRFEFILVDEYQDTSPLQDKIFRKMAVPNNNIFVVGDENQSIYGFRGATLENFQNFSKYFTNAKEYFLSTNFRSTKNIVEASNKILERKIRKKLKAKREQGETIIILKSETADSVAEKTIKLIKELKLKDIIHKYGDVSLLSRTKRAFEDYIRHLDLENIPYITFGDGQFINRLEIRTMIYLLSYVTQKLYMKSQFREWQNWWDIELFTNEVMGFSPKTINAINKMSKKINISNLFNEKELRKLGILDKPDIEKIIQLNRIKLNIEKKIEEKEDISFLKSFYDILKTNGYMQRLLKKDDLESKEKLFNLAKLSQIINQFEVTFQNSNADQLFKFIYFNAIDNAFDQYKIENEASVKLMTVHKAKGLEFPIVIVCSLLEGRFPLRYRETDEICGIPIDRKFYFNKDAYKNSEEKFYNEELRLFYVAMSRAQDILILTTSEKIKVQKSKPSRFLNLIQDYVTEDINIRTPVINEYKKLKDISNLSYSSLNSFIDCPFRYQLVNYYGFVTPVIFTQKVGIFIHNVLQRIHIEIKNGKKLGKKDIENFINEYWIPLFHRKDKDDKEKRKYLKPFCDYYQLVREIFPEIEEIEKPFTYIGKNMIIKGKIDLIAKDTEGKINLIDFKASRKEGIRPTNVETQLNIYRYCLKNKQIDKLIAYTFMDNHRELFNYNESKLEKLFKDLSYHLENEIFERNKESQFCKSGQCLFKFLC